MSTPLAVPDPGGPASPPITDNYWGEPADSTAGLASLIRTELPPTAAAPAAVEPEPAPAPAPPPVAAPAPGFDPGRLERLEGELNALRGGGLSQEIAKGFVQALGAWQANAAAAAPPSAPEPPAPPADLDELVGDPRALNAYFEQVKSWSTDLAKHTREQVLAEVKPSLDAATQIQAMAGPVFQAQQRSAIQEAANLASQSGYDEATFRTCLPDAMKIIHRADVKDPAERVRMALDPRTILHALNMVRTELGGGMPPITERSAPPPSAPTPSAPTSTAPAKDDYVRLTEKILGVQFDANDIAYRDRLIASGAEGMKGGW